MVCLLASSGAAASGAVEKPMKRVTRALCVLAAVMLPVEPAHACTTFCYEDGGTLVFGRNYDWNASVGLVLVNKHGVVKRAMVESGAAEWTSRYGSLTFNQYGREFPTGGMNEKGLVVELMWLDETEYPAPDVRGALPTLQWIQYQLDRSATVDDVLTSDRVVRIANGGPAKIHFLVADVGGGVATVEFLKGELVAHRGRDLPYPALTNDTYERSVQFARDTGPRAGRTSLSSLERFARAAGHARRAATPADAVRNAFATLDDVAQGEYTQWSIVYDLHDRRAYFRTHVARDVRWVDLDDLAFGCETPVSMLDVNAALSGDVAARLTPYRPAANRDLVHAAFAQTPFLSTAPAQARDRLARYPASTTCAAAVPRGK
jgi:choloylglycine hydrolase